MYIWLRAKWSWAKLRISYFNTPTKFDTQKNVMCKNTDILFLYVSYIWYSANAHEQNYWYHIFIRFVHLTKCKRSLAKLLKSYFFTFYTFDTVQKIKNRINDILLFYVFFTFTRCKRSWAKYWYLTIVRLIHLAQSKRPWSKLLISSFYTFGTFDTEQSIMSKITEILHFTSCSFDREQTIMSKINDVLFL